MSLLGQLDQHVERHVAEPDFIAINRLSVHEVRAFPVNWPTLLSQSSTFARGRATWPVSVPISIAQLVGFDFIFLKNDRILSSIEVGFCGR
ncbi:hypothetical protein FVE85_0452 [Porphyridium purpureum]|uniref:Uncharacterized protein n=1 Tax=Porphyridium purpureum TaxID=35688 RepID=A0A5J4Z1G2_PORPP|nr:hypothetical protein FVE85_0452 [Porphyridium purpureum]|eukprot:POR6451..scf208_2